MYLDFYQLAKTPFPIASDPESFYFFPDHKAALGCLVYGIEAQLGCVVVTGDAGLGKTALLRTYVERADPEIVKTICIWHADVTFANVLQTLLEGLECDRRSDDTSEMQLQVYEALLSEARRGRTVALLIDEAQTMSVEALAKLRLLLNLETETQKLLQIVLVGLPELFRMLQQKALGPLRQHVMLHGTLKPLTKRESLTYLQSRLDNAANTSEPIFTRQAFRCLAKMAKGNPRMLNILSTNALIEGMNAEEKPITARTTRQVARMVIGRRYAAKWRYGFGSVGAAAALVLFLWMARLPWPTVDDVLWSVTPVSKTQDQGAIQEGVDIEALVETPDKSILPAVDRPSGTKSLSPAVAAAFPIKITARPGETIADMCMEIYGFINATLLSLIERQNPEIVDLQALQAGDMLFLPALPNDIERRCEANNY